jgi:hypothetical protein
MLKKILIIFQRDLKVNFRDSLSALLLLMPILFAVIFNILSPGINDTTVNIALVENENIELQEYLSDFAKVSVYPDESAIIERVDRRDDVFAYLNSENGYYVLKQGNESENSELFATYMLTFYNEDVQISDTTAEIIDFNRTVPPFKKLLVNIAIMFISIMGGMLIAINILEEKNDKTIRAIHLTPVNDNAFIIGKGFTGIFLTIYGTISIVLITGFTQVNWGQLLLLVLVSSIISLLVGFMMGLTSETFMDAAGSVKMLFIPLMAAVLVVELLAEKWQWTVYWSPFYWTYLALDDILSYTGTWGFTLIASGIVLAISTVIYLILMPRIRKGLM